MNIKIEYTETGKGYIQEFPIDENKIIVRIQEIITVSQKVFEKEETPIHISKITDDEGISRSVYGYIKNNGGEYSFRLHLISTTIKKKEYSASEIMNKAKKK